MQRPAKRACDPAGVGVCGVQKKVVVVLVGCVSRQWVGWVGGRGGACKAQTWGRWGEECRHGLGCSPNTGSRYGRRSAQGQAAHSSAHRQAAGSAAVELLAADCRQLLQAAAARPGGGLSPPLAIAHRPGPRSFCLPGVSQPSPRLPSLLVLAMLLQRARWASTTVRGLPGSAAPGPLDARERSVLPALRSTAWQRAAKPEGQACCPLRPARLLAAAVSDPAGGAKPSTCRARRAGRPRRRRARGGAGKAQGTSRAHVSRKRTPGSLFQVTATRSTPRGPLPPPPPTQPPHKHHHHHHLLTSVALASKQAVLRWPA